MPPPQHVSSSRTQADRARSCRTPCPHRSSPAAARKHRPQPNPPRPNPTRCPIDLQVPLRHFQRRPRNIDARYPRAHPRQMQREPALVRAHIERLAPRITRRSRIILPLIQKRARLLPTRRIEVKAQPIQPKNCARHWMLSVPRKQRRRRRHAQLLQFANPRVLPLQNRL